jgi:hypothetical protein
MRPGNAFMKTSTSALLPVILFTISALGGCEWIAGIENTSLGADAMRPADAALPPDAGMANRPDGGVPVELDGGVGVPDAAVTRACPEPCAGDAFAEFDVQQGGLNGNWRYIEIEADEQYADMDFTLFSAPIYGWQGTGSEPPLIVFCDVGVSDSPCFEPGGKLALTSNAPDGHHPALRWTAATEGTYLVTAFWRGSKAASPIETLVTITHDNGIIQFLVGSQQFPLTTVTHMFEEEVVVEAGDRIVLGVQPVDDGMVTVEVDLFISFF